MLFVRKFKVRSYIYISIGVMSVFSESSLDVEAKSHQGSYYSELNAPEFYGTTKVVIKIGDSFDVNDAKYRIFARDFEDGDLTKKIELVSNTVDTTKTGSYTVQYAITDSHQNTTTLTVPVEVTDAPDINPKVERTLFTLPSMDNMAKVGTHRANQGDSQHLGIFMPAHSSIKIKMLSGSKDKTFQLMNNDSHTEKSVVVKSDNSELLITADYGSVPFLKTNSGDNLEKEVVEIEFIDPNIKSLNYYHYQDDETSFMENWRKDTDSYAVIENEVVTVLVPYHDIDKITIPTDFSNGFHTLDEFLYYWQEVVDFFDYCLGLDFNPENPLDQNVRSRYKVKANRHGAGAAYYSIDHVGVNDLVLLLFFNGIGGIT